MFRVMRDYMRMVVEMLAFIKSVRTGDWELHLTSVELFTKYFFSHDRLNYARMIPVYQAEMVWPIADHPTEFYWSIQRRR